ncbi:hypothetical protein [Aquipuribacter nitratireducens]|uniref:Uncharacterized protein n=1 Tax=Aquipuribacter nitratireducens TaxID=650104 RepID=A0ABW0GK38_9MICO
MTPVPLQSRRPDEAAAVPVVPVEPVVPGALAEPAVVDLALLERVLSAVERL